MLPLESEGKAGPAWPWFIDFQALDLTIGHPRALQGQIPLLRGRWSGRRVSRGVHLQRFGAQSSYLLLQASKKQVISGH